MQLLPLPFNIWLLLPGRGLILETYALIGEPPPLLPMTMTPGATWLSALSLLPPIAIFLGVLTLNRTARRTVALVVITMAIAGVFLGLLQLAEGPKSALRFYDITNRTEAVGFFANRNHFGSLLYVSMLFVTAYFVEAVMVAGQKTQRRLIDVNAMVPVIMWVTALAILLAGEMMARSRAGLSLTLVASLATIGFSIDDPRIKSLRSGFGKAIFATTVAALISFLPLALYRILDRLGSDPSADVRIPFARNTISAAMVYMPFGSGLGSFVPVYQLFEKGSDISLSYANHAHNDLLEVWLETGVPGVALIAVFGAWLVRRMVLLWRSENPGTGGIDLSLRRAAAVAVLLLLAHSLVDYPLRTTAMMAVAAMAVGLLMTTPPRRRMSGDQTDCPGSI